MDEIKIKKRYKYYTGGKYLLEKRQYLGKNRHGLSTIYYPSGNKWAEIEFEHGKKNGKLIEWSKDGKIRLECHFKNNREHGAYISWWANGNLKEKGFFREGKKVGKYSWYNQDGSLCKTHDYDE